MDSTLVALNKGPTAVVFICPSNRHGIDEPVESLMFKSFGLVEISTKVFFPFICFSSSMLFQTDKNTLALLPLCCVMKYQVKQQSLLNKKYFAALLLV